MSVTVHRIDCFQWKDPKGFCQFDLVIADPPYGGILNEKWDEACYDRLTANLGVWMKDGATAYVWGGVGTRQNRPFFRWLAQLENHSGFVIHNIITWSKKRAYGKADNYLFTREECAMLVKGCGKPKTFNIPLLDEKRGYAGYNPKYPAKSEFKRVTNVWTDITELFQGKIHPAEKPAALAERMIRTSSNDGDRILDPFAGSGSTGIAALRVGKRRCVLLEKDSCRMHSFEGAA